MARQQKRIATLFVIAAVALGPAAVAQPQLPEVNPVSGLPLESVIVSTTKPSQAVIHNYVETRTGRTYILGRTARWIVKLCPQTSGLGDKYATYISQRIRDVAAAIGAPVDDDPACRPNIEVVFTTAPQDLIDNIAMTDPLYLGYHQTRREAAELAKVRLPIQAWYTTLVQGNYEHRPMGYGGGTVDVGKCPVTGSVSFKTTNGHDISIPCSAPGAATGNRAKDGLNSGFFNILILADPGKLSDYEVGSLADYIALLALSQPDALDTCETMLSISNLLAKNCGAAASKITDTDLAYLRALYKLPGGDLLVSQREYISRQMTKMLAGDKAD
jgi:hypothetical protein